ncbi:cytochrome b [Streptomyces gulbargensis]|uniref:cytochrome b n=1 Tax=Streptomyces gulbargensis TaxID=364901 RepID=UPI0031F19E6E
MGPTTGYRPVTKLLHWTVVLAFAAQFVLGYALDASESGRGRGRGEGPGRGRGGGFPAFGEDGPLTAHILLGVTIVLLGAVRLVLRRRLPLPPWAPTLSAAERRLAHRTETALYALTFAVPATGLVLLASGDDLLWLHVTAHLAFFAALAAHVGLVLKHQLVDRDRLLRRML